MISIDTETTGIDFYHGAKPYFVTTCNEAGEQQWYEWDVDPLTRDPIVPKEDYDALSNLIWGADGYDHEEYVLQNAKFDVSALLALFDPVFGQAIWPWETTHDTLLAGHLLASNRPHDLTTMALMYLSIDIQHYEDAIQKATIEARRMAKSQFPDWRQAKKGYEEMPSAKDKTWKYDMWLPRALAKELQYSSDHPWWTVLADYANADSAVTIQLWRVQEVLLKERDLWEIYLEKLKNLPALHEMELRGITLSKTGLDSVKKEYEGQVYEAETICKNIAGDYDLTLPKSGNNKSLTQFVFGELNLPVLKITEAGNASLDKYTLDEYLLVLPRNSKGRVFVSNLKRKRKRDTALGFIYAYEKYWLPFELSEDWMLLHCSVNPTGTATTRVSCSNPNLQQVAKQESLCQMCEGDGCETCNFSGEDIHSMRAIFGPAPGREMWTADAKNIELRIPAYESEEPDLITLFERPDDPPFYGSQHLLNFSVVYEDIWQGELGKICNGCCKGKVVDHTLIGPHCKKKFASTWYQYCKNGDFAIQYQCGMETADLSFRRPGSFIKLKTKFSRLDALNKKQVAHAENYGYVETMPDKTVNPRRGYPLLCSRSNYGKIIPTTPLNYHTQGTAGWWMVKAINRCRAQLLEWNKTGFDGRMVLTVHDELMFDFPKSLTHPSRDAELEKKPGGAKFRTSHLWRMRVLQRLMEQGGQDIGIPTPVSVEYHDQTWAEGVSL